MYSTLMHAYLALLGKNFFYPLTIQASSILSSISPPRYIATDSNSTIVDNRIEYMISLLSPSGPGPCKLDPHHEREMDDFRYM